MNNRTKALLALQDYNKNQITIANELGVSRSLICRIMKQLQDQGLVELVEAPNRRERWFTITEKAKMEIDQ